MSWHKLLRVGELRAAALGSIGEEEVQDLVEVGLLDRTGLLGRRLLLRLPAPSRPDDVREAVARPGQLAQRARNILQLVVLVLARILVGEEVDYLSDFVI